MNYRNTPLHRMPSARDVRDGSGQVEIGNLLVSYDPCEGHAGLGQMWHLKGPLFDDMRETIDQFDTYREAVREAKRRTRAPELSEASAVAQAAIDWYNNSRRAAGANVLMRTIEAYFARKLFQAK